MRIRRNKVRAVVVLLASAPFFLACYDTLDMAAICPPYSVSCADRDYDGDGIPNAVDDFPLDPNCSAQDETNCSACGSGCDLGNVCEDGQCVFGCRGDEECSPKFCQDGRCAECRTLDDCTVAGAKCNAGRCVVPVCDGKACGDDGWGSSCGECTSGLFCVSGQCVSCRPNCAGMVCGNDGCGGSCGACAAGRKCEVGQCVECVPDCAGRECGDDNCGGSCGNGCPQGTSCFDASFFVLSSTSPYDEFLFQCLSDCDYRQGPLSICLDQSTQGNCLMHDPDTSYWGLYFPLPCAEGTHCRYGACVADTGRSCTDRQCGDDGAGGSCGSCSSGKKCTDGLYFPYPDNLDEYLPTGYICADSKSCSSDLNYAKCLNSTTLQSCTVLAQDMGGWFAEVDIWVLIAMPCASGEVCTVPTWNTSTAFCEKP